MKKYIIISIAFAVLFSFGQKINAQSLKDLKNKTEKTTKNLNNNSNKKNSNTNTNTNSNSNTEVKDNKNTNDNSGSEDKGLEEWFKKKYEIINDYESTLSESALQRGEMNPKKALNFAKELEYPKTIAILEEKKIAVKASLDNYKVEKMKKYGEVFTASYMDTYKPLINKKIEEAYQYKKKNEGYAVKLINEANTYMEVIMLIIQENQDAIKLNKDLEGISKNILDPYYARVFTSNFHKKNVGKILFSNKPITVGKEDSTQFKTTFLPTENIYAVAYLNGKIKDIGDKDNGVYHVYIDDNENPTNISFGHNKGDENLSYYLIEILPQPDLAYHGLDPVEFGKILSGLSPRNHVMKLGFGGNYNSYAMGEITLDWVTADGNKILANNNLASKNAQDNWARNMKLSEVYFLPMEKYNDPDMSTEKIKAMILANEDFKDKISQIMKIQVTGYTTSFSTEDWVIYTNELGIPTNKASNRYIGIVYKGADGWCYFTECIYFVRDYEGGGTYSKPRLYFGSDVLNTKIDCKNVK